MQRPSLAMSWLLVVLFSFVFVFVNFIVDLPHGSVAKLVARGLAGGRGSAVGTWE